MSDRISANPYEPSPATDGSAATGLTQVQAILLALLALTLILRGVSMTFSWGMMLSSGFDLSSNFSAAIFTKDSIYGASALVGGVLLLVRHRIGWWAALAHWCWYWACEIVVVGTAAALNWQIPVGHDPPQLYRVMGFTALLGFAGLAILLWRPITRACRGPADRRIWATSATLLASVVVAFGVNLWMSVR